MKLIVSPGTVLQWRDFVKGTPGCSIALDGYVRGMTKRDNHGPHANFNHHEESDRMSTRATCAQVYLEINLGLFKTFRQNNIPDANIYVNDCDEDVCLSVWLLQNHERVIGHGEPLINRLVQIEDLLDTTAGMYPLGDVALRRTMAWIFEPYYSFKSGEMSDGQTIIEAVGKRISQYVNGQGEELPLEGQYEIVSDQGSWVLARERGPFARALLAEKYDAFVIHRGEFKEPKYELPRHRYVIGRRSVWTPFPLQEIYEELNDNEVAPLLLNSTNAWDGGNTIGGSPRKSGSSLPPAELIKVVNDLIRKTR